jgi:hypothetical protein
MSLNRYINISKEPLIDFIKIPVLPTDEYIQYKVGVTVFDNLSFEYYGNSEYSYLIKNANPQKIFEFDFENGDIIRIPLPLQSAIDRYNISKNKLYTLNN